MTDLFIDTPQVDEKSERTDVIGIRFTKLGRLYNFRVGRLNINVDDDVVVETRKGQQLGKAVRFVPPNDPSRRRKMRPILRKATPRDLVLQQVWEGKNLDALITCREKAFKLGIRNVKFIRASFNFDGSWITIYYSTEERGLPIGKLKEQMESYLSARVEMQLIGPRDVARLLGGFGACGGPRCCSTFLTEFSPVSIKMAKEQGISLSPNEITGMCGRLRCCLIYEYEQYVEARKKLPKVNSRIGTPKGEAKVIDVRVMRDSVVAILPNGERIELFRDEIEPLEELKALKKKAAAGCSKHEGGECDCGSHK